MILPIAAQWILGLASLIAGGGVVWTFGRRLYRIDAAMPVLLKIAEQFDPDASNGQTLYQRIIAIETELKNIKTEMEKLNGK